MSHVMTVIAIVITIACCHDARAQNDWQYPDPYFGAIEIEKSQAVGPANRSPAKTAAPSVKSRPRIWRNGTRATGQMNRLRISPAPLTPAR